jgi:hypothetical protein
MNSLNSTTAQLAEILDTHRAHMEVFVQNDKATILTGIIQRDNAIAETLAERDAALESLNVMTIDRDAQRARAESSEANAADLQRRLDDLNSRIDAAQGQ